MPDESAPLFLTIRRSDGTTLEIREDAISLIERRQSDVRIVLTRAELTLDYAEARPLLDHFAAKVRAGL